MAVQHYESKDIMPMVLSVLTIAVFNLTHVAFKVAIEKEFPDIKGLISTDILDKPALEMLETMPENEWSKLISECIHSIENSITTLAFYYDQDWHQEFKKTKPIDMSIDFLKKIGFYRNDDEFENHWDELENITRFCSYVFYLLCKIILSGRIDFDVYYEGYDIDFARLYMEDLAVLANGNQQDVLVLSNLGFEMLDYYVRLVQLESRDGLH
ncbi:hypothetical protein [Pedobacter hartonius]|uniref:Uncharacterized protein n=1 Tax=Pedobacter hartonius TaxID=425514 RepID=A0A1H4AZQ6_9SPHI|nr:hypothetical protein [Pedobacter hartonius]SEA41403.1 hypothetical protein SAMN05443550_103152 [Pedobacter hartonius]